MDDGAVPLHGICGSVIRDLVRNVAQVEQSMKGGDPSFILIASFQSNQSNPKRKEVITCFRLAWISPVFSPTPARL